MCMCLTRFTDVFIYFKLTNTIKEILKQLWVDLDSFCFIKVFFIIPQSCVVILLGSPQIRVELFDYLFLKLIQANMLTSRHKSNCVCCILNLQCQSEFYLITLFVKVCFNRVLCVQLEI